MNKRLGKALTRTIEYVDEILAKPDDVKAILLKTTSSINQNIIVRAYFIIDWGKKQISSYGNQQKSEYK